MEDITLKTRDASPEEKTLVNIVDLIPEDKQKEIAAEICADFDNDIQSRSEWEEKRNRYYKLWACLRKPKTEPWVGSSNVCIPMLSEACNQYHGRAYLTFFTSPEIVKVLPVGANDLRRARNVEQYMNWQLFSEMDEFEEVFDRVFQLLPINGTAFKKKYYSKELDRVVDEYIPVLDLVLPYATKTLETARRITHVLWLHYDELLDRDEQKLYSNFDKISQEATRSTTDGDLVETKDEATGERPTESKDNPHKILETHRKWSFNGKREPYIFTVDYDTKTLIRATSRVFKAGAEEKVLNYFNDYHFIPNPEGFYSFGWGHFLEPLNEMANTGFNQIFDSGRLTNQPFGFYSRRAGFKTKKIKLKPGLMTEVEDASQIFFPNMQRVDQVLFMVLGLIQQYTERFTSTSDYLSGRESSGTKTPTKGGTLAIIEQGLVTFSVMIKRMFRSFKKELRNHYTFNQIYLSEAKQFRVTESIDKIAFSEIRRQDFDGKYDLIPTGDPSYASKGVRREEAMAVYQVMMSNPLVIGTPPDKETGETAMPPNPRAIYEVTKDFLESYDKKNIGKILPEIPEDPMTPEMENALFMQGDYKSPVQGEDHANHFQVHLNFKTTEFYRVMLDDYKPLLEKHLQETEQIAYLDTQQTAQLGGGNGQPANIQV